MLNTKEAYRLKLKDVRWINLRLKVLQRDQFKCTYCFSPENTQVHHLVYIGEPWECPINFLVTLCDKCHEKESKERKLYEKALLEMLSMSGFSYYNVQAIAQGFANNNKAFHPDTVADMLNWLLSNPDILHIVIQKFQESQAMYSDKLLF